jgi:hypothetical protein
MVVTVIDENGKKLIFEGIHTVFACHPKGSVVLAAAIKDGKLSVGAEGGDVSDVLDGAVGIDLKRS